MVSGLNNWDRIARHREAWERAVAARPGVREAGSSRARGATIEYVTCYRRVKPSTDPAPLLRLWEEGQLDAVTMSSSEGLRNLFEMLGRLGQAWLKKTPVFVPHVRIAEQAHGLGLAKVVATDPGDDGLLAGLRAYFDRNHAPR